MSSIPLFKYPNAEVFVNVASSQNPPLTTVKQDMEVMGERAAEELLHMIKDKTYAPQVIIVDTTLIKRGTCTSPN
ncbi:substrate-binding domain-containing protein [Sulfoacidibacillus ferrooxidans]|uniref:substrate-binding domain-containing protein n=1 Tax=Sulfoacidibacillus ferrooxidans TaxID=2005001 RepID=UPI003AFA592C